MTPNDPIDFEDVGQAIREDRALRPAPRYRIQFAQDGLDFRAVDVESAIPLGQQILAAAGLSIAGEFSLFAILSTGDFEDVLLNEPFDLRGAGAEKFVAFQSDRDYRLMVNQAQMSWGKPAISGRTLYQLSEAKENEVVLLEVPGGDDRLIEDSDLIDLTAAGVERFFTAHKPQHAIQIVVNGREVEVPQSHQTFEDLVAIAYPGEPPMPNVTYSMTYRKVASVPHSGELAAGGFIEVKNGSIVNVGRTVQS
ncbi:multiubiquitin domain-containing protein [Solilutibacter silvestris]|uniref:Bacterial multiubiquitin n=1 Tax=Solilutibacter silvestris TaxID=1645665 RepID=A0A2K1Q453_9GAMM|nr:multiubiquitin domain-containing protein [Lysobacter silvestris]PNS09830.1 Bacterial multiubiquitin [Lysobacter silvestris]